MSQINIPLFPLSIFLIPGETCALHIFEERYRALIAWSIEHSRPFGIPCNHVLNTANSGSLVEVSKVTKRYPGGESDIEVRCVGLFRLDRFFYRMEDELYPGGSVEPIDWKQSMELEWFKGTASEAGRPKSTAVVSDALSRALELDYDLADKLRWVKALRSGQGMRFLERRNEYYDSIRLQEEQTSFGFYWN
jgi:Lon protease-like protein